MSKSEIGRTGRLDTNTVILLPRLADPDHMPDEPAISTITLAELWVGPLLARTAVERAARQAHVQQAEADFDPIGFDVAADLRHAGRKTSARAYDALIAAVAIANDIPLYTVNPTDFTGIDELDVVAILHPDQKTPS